MKVEFISNLNRQYMAVVPEQMTGYPYRMILENSISGILPASHAVIDGSNYLYFDITGKISAASLYGSRSGDRVFFEELINAIAEAQLSLQRYLIPGDSLMVLPELIFRDPHRARFCFGILPDGNKHFGADMLKLSEFLIAALPGDDRAAAQIVYEFYQACAAERLSPEELLMITGRKRRENDNKEFADLKAFAEAPDPYTGFLQADAFESSAMPEEAERAGKRKKRRRKQKKSEKPAEILSRSEKKDKASDMTGLKGLIRYLNTDRSELKKQKQRREDEKNEEFFRSLMEKDRQSRSGKKTGAGQHPFEIRKQNSEEETGTTLISEKQKILRSCSAYLIPKDPYGTAPVPIVKEITLIGRVKERCDVVLKNGTVSRIHARLIRRGDQFELYDEGSANGTKVNAEQLSPGVPFPLLDGDEVSFAEENWSFHLRRDSGETERISGSVI